MNQRPLVDLVVLVPGTDDQQTLTGLLSKRWQSLGIREIRHRIIVHPRHDPGCFHEGPAILQTFAKHALHGLVIFDHEGSGQETRAPDELRQELVQRLDATGWAGRAEVVVIVPELEIWVWSPSPLLDRVIGWADRQPVLREWLLLKKLWPQDRLKPERPKECFESALREARTQKSSAIYKELAETVSLEKCQDPSFRRLVGLLKEWFPPVPEGRLRG